jgi:DNA processing protein
MTACYTSNMYDESIRELQTSEFPRLLSEIPQPPKKLWATGALPDSSLALLAVVGSRKYTSYGKQVVDYLISGLKNTPIGIVSGLALGIDTLAHEAALRNNLYTIAVPGSGLNNDVLYPASNKQLARKIIESGGGLLSELEPTTKAAQWTFPQRNRIMAGMCHATLLIEAEEKSGTLITARLASDYNRELLAVPGNIFSSHTRGTHQFIKLGATPVTHPEDILHVLHIEKAVVPTRSKMDFSMQEISVFTLLKEPTDKDTLIRKLQLPTHEANILLMQMELFGYISNANGMYSARIQHN